jgi:hypothetical protein
MPGTIERALELARTGTLQNLSDLKKKLAAEGHDSIDAHISGMAIKRQLATLMKAAKA